MFWRMILGGPILDLLSILCGVFGSRQIVGITTTAVSFVFLNIHKTPDANPLTKNRNLSFQVISIQFLYYYIITYIIYIYILFTSYIFYIFSSLFATVLLPSKKPWDFRQRSSEARTWSKVGMKMRDRWDWWLRSLWKKERNSLLIMSPGRILI